MLLTPFLLGLLRKSLGSQTSFFYRMGCIVFELEGLVKQYFYSPRKISARLTWVAQ